LEHANLALRFCGNEKMDGNFGLTAGVCQMVKVLSRLNCAAIASLAGSPCGFDSPTGGWL
jgi:hypothetical protein